MAIESTYNEHDRDPGQRFDLMEIFRNGVSQPTPARVNNIHIGSINITNHYHPPTAPPPSRPQYNQTGDAASIAPSTSSTLSSGSAKSNAVEHFGKGLMLGGASWAVASAFDPTLLNQAGGAAMALGGAALVTTVKVCRWCAQKIQQYRHRNCADDECFECWKARNQ